MLPHALSKLPFVERFYSYPVAASTSDSARAMTELPTKGIFVLQADRQTAGRGRSGASFFSDNEGGLWVTIIAPVQSMERHFVHNRALSLAICQAAESQTDRPGSCAIKWPNDIYWGNRKLCGILLESHAARNDLLIMGFGMNVNIERSEFPLELQSLATSLLIETGRRFSRSQLLAAIIEHYHTNLTMRPEAIHHDYHERLYRLGSMVKVEGRQGIFDGVELDGRLKLLVEHDVVYMVSGNLHFIGETA